MNRYDLYYQAPPAGAVLPLGLSKNCRKTFILISKVYVGIILLYFWQTIHVFLLLEVYNMK